MTAWRFFRHLSQKHFETEIVRVRGLSVKKHDKKITGDVFKIFTRANTVLKKNNTQVQPCHRNQLNQLSLLDARPVGGIDTL